MNITPGKWKWWTSNSFRRLKSEQENGHSVYVMRATIAGDGHPDIEVSEADMNLIAAAPDLLHALLETREGKDFDDGLPCWCPSPTLVRVRRLQGKEPFHRPLCGMARAALAKAEGREP